MNSPYFSIVISVYNRAEIVKRCIKSCLSQTYDDFEIIIVNDGSTDDTQKALDSFQNPRIKVITHPKNLGHSPARNTGVKNASGNWIIILDSDHALLPHALENLHTKTLSTTSDVGVIGSRYRWDTGQITPAFMPDGVIDYVGRIKWAEEEGGTDYLCCARREVYEVVSWPSDRRGGMDTLFQLNLAKNFNEDMWDKVLALEFSDAMNSVTRGKGSLRVITLLKNSSDLAWKFEEIFRRHGDMLKIWGPRQYQRCFRDAGKNHFLAGHRLHGIYRMAQYLVKKPGDFSAWIILILGLIHPIILAKANAWKYILIK